MVTTSGTKRGRRRTQPAVAPEPTPGAVHEPEAIFVVGVSRSGTTLLRKVLETSERIAIAPESDCAGHVVRGQGARDQFRRLGELDDDETVRRIVDLLYSGDFQRRSRWREIAPFWRWLIREIAPAELEQRLLAADRTERGLMAAFLRTYADFMGRPVMGEKAPAHLRYVDTLLEWFPRGKVVHIVRDPRAVYVSDCRQRRQRPTSLYSWLMRLPLLFPATMLVQTTLAWNSAARRHRRLERNYPNVYRMIRFEDLVRQPDTELPRLFDFLGVALPAGATDVQVVSRGLDLGAEGLDVDAVDRWREHIHPLARRLLKLLLGRQMRRLGYTD
jgi:hypothetical protein